MQDMKSVLTLYKAIMDGVYVGRHEQPAGFPVPGISYRG